MQGNQPTTQEIAEKLYEKLKPSGWYAAMRLFLISKEFTGIIDKLKYITEVEKRRFMPGIAQCLRWMYEVPVDKVKCVIMVDHISNLLDYYEGIPISIPIRLNSLNEPIKFSPSYLLKDIKRTLDMKEDENNLMYWVEQGILIMPMSCTSYIEGSNHYSIWKPFIIRVINTLNQKRPNIPWLLLGNSGIYEEDINSVNIRCCPTKPFKDKEAWEWVNTVLKKRKTKPIVWIPNRELQKPWQPIYKQKLTTSSGISSSPTQEQSSQQ